MFMFLIVYLLHLNVSLRKLFSTKIYQKNIILLLHLDSSTVNILLKVNFSRKMFPLLFIVSFFTRSKMAPDSVF